LISKKNYNVFSGKFVPPFDENTVFQTNFKLPEVSKWKRNFDNSNYNVISKTVIKQEKKPLNIFISQQPFQNNKNLQIQTDNQQNEIINCDLRNNSIETAQIYNIYENKEQATSKNDIPFQTIPIIENPTGYSNNNTLLNSYIVQRPLSMQYEFSDINWATITFISLGILLAYMRLLFGKFFKQIIKSLFVSNSANRIYLEKSLILNRLLKIMDIFSLLVIATGITLLFDYFGFHFIIKSSPLELTGDSNIYKLPAWQSYFIFILLILIILTVKKLLNFIIIKIFGIKEIMSEYLFHSKLYFITTCSVLFLPIIIIPYISVNNVFIVYYLLLFIIFSGYIIRFLRLIIITFKKGFSFLYLFLYFCALEFCPIIILCKSII